jgi:hypothetical protein
MISEKTHEQCGPPPVPSSSEAAEHSHSFTCSFDVAARLSVGVAKLCRVRHLLKWLSAMVVLLIAMLAAQHFASDPKSLSMWIIGVAVLIALPFISIVLSAFAAPQGSTSYVCTENALVARSRYGNHSFPWQSFAHFVHTKRFLFLCRQGALPVVFDKRQLTDDTVLLIENALREGGLRAARWID